MPTAYEPLPSIMVSSPSAGAGSGGCSSASAGAGSGGGGGAGWAWTSGAVAHHPASTAAATAAALVGLIGSQSKPGFSHLGFPCVHPGGSDYFTEVAAALHHCREQSPANFGSSRRSPAHLRAECRCCQVRRGLSVEVEPGVVEPGFERLAEDVGAADAVERDLDP
jgi:hypothetical protein